MNDFQEYFDMLMVLGECRKHYRNAQDLYAARYPDKEHKSHMAFKRLADRFCRFRTVKQTQVKRRRRSCCYLSFCCTKSIREQQANGKKEWN